jgi:hypothetical protein
VCGWCWVKLANRFMAALGFLVTRAGLQPDAIVRDLKQSPDTLTRLLPKIIAGGSDRKTLVLFLDQMEELFTAQDVEQSNKFLAALYLAAQEKALWVIATIRSDHLQFCHRHPDMLQVLRGQSRSKVNWRTASNRSSKRKTFKPSCSRSLVR